MGKRISALAMAFVLVFAAACPGLAFAEDASLDDSPESADPSSDKADSSSPDESTVVVDDVVVSAEGEAALIEGATFAVDDFSRAQKGSNRELDGQYLGYSLSLIHI